MQDPKLPRRPIHDECCQEGAQQREEGLNIYQHLAQQPATGGKWRSKAFWALPRE